MANDIARYAVGGNRGSIIKRESSNKKLIEQSRIRLYCITAFFLMFFMAICCRLVDATVLHHSEQAAQNIPANPTDEQLLEEAAAPLPLSRNDIVDRNGMVLATTLATESLFANPQDLHDPHDAAKKIAAVFPDINAKELEKKLSRDESNFVWIKRNLTPKEQHAANNIGIPGLYFQPEQKRVYPYGNLLSHVIGFVGVDHKGLGGIEKTFDERLRDTKDNREPLKLSIDLRVQNIVHEELKHSMEAFNAIGAAGVVLDIHTGELLALASLPDFDPHQVGTASENARFNRVSLGSYEMGSTFKTFTTAMALDYGVVNLNDGYDASHPLEYAHAVIRDDHPQNRWLTIPEIYTYSSNIGTARMALDVGTERQKAFLRKIGLMDPVKIELPELGSSHYPSDWHEISTMTIAYGHGMAVTPLHLIRAFASIVNGGTLEPLTLIEGGNDNKPAGVRVINEKTSSQMRRLMRMVVEFGTGKQANVAGYRVGGKTGTAEKVGESGGYNHHANMALFVSTFPVDNPKYVVLVMLDEPKGEKSTYGFATAGWNAVPTAGAIIARMAPMFGIPPIFDVVPEDAVNRYWVDNANQKFVHVVSY
jgi:cell division protein FtsI (penicillin-binding protein 3)